MTVYREEIERVFSMDVGADTLEIHLVEYYLHGQAPHRVTYCAKQTRYHPVFGREAVWFEEVREKSDYQTILEKVKTRASDLVNAAFEVAALSLEKDAA